LDNCELKPYEIKRQERKEKCTKFFWYFIAVIYIILMLFQIGKSIYKHQSDYYKPMFYILDELNLSKNYNYNVYINKSAKTIKYSFIDERQRITSPSTVLDLFKSYLADNPDNILNDDYKISFSFIGIEHVRYKYVKYIISNFYRGVLHDDFDTLTFYNIDDVCRDLNMGNYSNISGYKYLSIYYAYDGYTYEQLLSKFEGVIEADIDLLYGEYCKIYNVIKESNPDIILHNRNDILYANVKTIYDLAYASDNLPNYVYINENDKYVMYLATQAELYSPDIMLVRWSGDMQYSNDNAYYNGSIVDNYLENTVYNSYTDGMRSIIREKNIDILNLSGKKESIVRHVFILSLDEINSGETDYINESYYRKTWIKSISGNSWTRTLKENNSVYISTQNGTRSSSGKITEQKYVNGVLFVDKDAELEVSYDIKPGYRYFVFKVDK